MQTFETTLDPYSVAPQTVENAVNSQIVENMISPQTSISPYSVTPKTGPAENVVNPQIIIDTGKSRLWVIPNYTPDIYNQLQNVFTYEEPPIVVFGKQGKQHRDVSFYSDESKGYHYSGQLMPSLPLANAPVLQQLLPAVNKSLGTNFNGILVNRYRDGTKYLSKHSDDEKALDKNTKMVVGLAYGAVRTFRITNKKTGEVVIDIPHYPCMLIVMQGDFQSEFKHEIPIIPGKKAQKLAIGERISITFRHHTV
jgi:alkylated DNA repair dioxygenase AlkB